MIYLKKLDQDFQLIDERKNSLIRLKDIALEILNEGIKLKDVKVKWLKDNPDLTDDDVNYYWNKLDAYNNPKPGKDKINPLKVPFLNVKKLLDLKFPKETSSIVDMDYEEYAYKNKLVVYNQNNMMVARGDNKAGCIVLGKGEKWCISNRDSSNRYYGYRYGLDYPTIYFSYDLDMLELDKDDINGILVIMVMEDEETYTVADRDNDINKGSKKVDWSYISKLQPKLSGIKYVFKYVPPTEEEKEKYKKMENISRLSSDKRLKVYNELTFDDKLLYMDVNHYLDGNMFKASEEKLQIEYIKMGGRLPLEILYNLSDKLKKELNYVLNKKIESDFNLEDEEFYYLAKNNEKDILIKYFNKKDTLNEDEFYYFSKKFSKELVLNYINVKIEKKRKIEKDEFEYLVKNKLKDTILNYIEGVIKIGSYLYPHELKYLEDNNLIYLLKNYINARIERAYGLEDYEFKYLEKFYGVQKYFDKIIEGSSNMGQKEFEYLLDNKLNDIITKYINNKLKNKYSLKSYEFKYFSENYPKDIIIKYINNRLKKAKLSGLSYYEQDYLEKNK